MIELKTICRVTVYADGALERTLLQQFLKLGSTGYTVTVCRGKGEHDTVDDPFATVTRVRIELLVQPEVAEKILKLVDSPQYKSHPLAACMETVQVAASERY
jgi:Nitrogen regulatory protein P-II